MIPVLVLRVRGFVNVVEGSTINIIGFIHATNQRGPVTREDFDFFIGEMERLTMIVCPAALEEEYWQKYKDADFINVQETIFKGPIKIEDFPIDRDNFNEVIEILEEGVGKKMPKEIRKQLWDDYGHLSFDAFREKITSLLLKGKK